MLFKTHLTFGILIGTIIYNYFPTYFFQKSSFSLIIFFILLLISSILPDIDHRKSKISSNIPILPFILSIFVKHRGIFHSIFAALAGTIVIALFNKFYAAAFFIGYLSHLILDSLTHEGINFGHPIARFHVHGFIKTGSFTESLLFICILFIISYAIFTLSF